MRSITDIVAQFKQTWTSELAPDAIDAACRDSGVRWKRSTLTPIVTIQVFFLQVLHGNTACEHLPLLSNMAFTAAAYCRARKRVALRVFELLLQRCVGRLQHDKLGHARWRGHRVFHLDGSSFSMPDTPELQAHFGQPGMQRPGCGFPTAHWLVMLHAGTGMVVKMLAGPLRTHDISRATQLHPELRAGDLLVADRGFCSYAHLALLSQRGVHGLLRVHQKTIVDFTAGRPHASRRNKKSPQGIPASRWIKQLGALDQVVAWIKPATRPGWMSAEQFVALPDSIKVRELRYAVDQRGFRTKQVTLVTTLLDAERYRPAELASQYAQRWEVETNFRHLKSTMKMDVLKCKTVAGVLRELHVFALVYNLVRQVMLEAAAQQRIDVRRISFIAALRWLQTASAGTELSRLVVNPLRPGRFEPRARKRRPKQYPLMKKPRRVLKQELLG